MKEARRTMMIIFYLLLVLTGTIYAAYDTGSFKEFTLRVVPAYVALTLGYYASKIKR